MLFYQHNCNKKFNKQEVTIVSYMLDTILSGFSNENSSNKATKELLCFSEKQWCFVTVGITCFLKQSVI